MTESPVSARDRAVMRAMAYWNCGWDEASYMVERSFIGRQMWLGESMRDLGQAVAAELHTYERTLSRVARRIFR